MSENFDAAIKQQFAWKNSEVRAFAIALITHALELLHAGTNRFTTDIVTDEERTAAAKLVDEPGTGIAGSVINMLLAAHVIEPFGHHHGGKFYHEKELSRRESRNVTRIGVYQLMGSGIARQFLADNQAPVPESQLELTAA